MTPPERPRSRCRRGGTPIGAVSKRYHPAAAASAIAFVAALATEDAGRVFGALLRIAETSETVDVDRATLASEAGILDAGGLERLERALLALRRVDLKLVETQTLPIDAEPSRVAMSAEFLDCLARPPVVHASGQAARLDPRAMAWIPVLVAATSKCTVEKGLHVAVRTADGYDADRLLVDLAERVAEAGATTWAPVCGAGCAWQIVRAELHTATRPRVVAMRNARLFEEPASGREPCDWDAPAAASEALCTRAEAELLFPAFASLRNVYLWPVPAGVLPPDVAEVIGAGIGPVSIDAEWATSALVARLPSIGEGGGARTILRARPDPRRADAVLTAVRAAIAAGMPPARACVFVTGSGPSGEDAPASPTDFDPRLLVCRPEAVALLHAADERTGRGGRVLAWGPPGGGKTSYALALAERIGGGGRAAISLSPGRILVRAWGATERLLRDAWARAEREGAVIVADEFGSLCGVREASSSGNAYLVRSLTDEMLRAMDAHPDVALIACVNDRASVEPAALRRFTFAFHFGDRLSTDQERLAWRRLLHMDPPAGWKPIGAAVADFPVAAAQCRALGLVAADAHAEALRDALAKRTCTAWRAIRSPLH